VSENVQETYPGTSAKNWNSRDDIPVVVVNSNSCRETLFSHSLEKGQQYTLVTIVTIGQGTLSNFKTVE